MSCFLPSFGAIAHLVGRADMYDPEVSAPQGRPERFTKEEIKAIIKDKESGMWQKDLAIKYKCSNNLICKTLRRYSKKHSGSRYTPDQILEMKAMYATGFKQREIADKFGCSQARVSEIVKHE